MIPYRILFFLCSVIVVVSQVSAHEPPSVVDTLYKQLQEDAQSAYKLFKESSLYQKEFEDEKVIGPFKSYLLKTNEVVYDSAKKLEKEIKPYYSDDLDKKLLSIRKQLEEVSKTIKKKEYVENLEKFHESYIESVKKLQEQLYEVAKTSPVKEHIPEKIQEKFKELFETYCAYSKKFHAQITDYIISLKKKISA